MTNWARILANAGLTFCTALVGFTAVGAGPEALYGAIFTALIQGGVAGFTEMKEECDEEEPKKKTTAQKVKKIISTGLIV